ncbi:MAG: EamA family transporter [Clostridia bacterium]|nr:EamA family transporter [Clostridia bacterium]
MNAIFLTLIIIGVSMQQVSKKAFNARVPGGVFGFSAASALAAAIVFLITSGGNLNFDPAIIAYSAAFATSYVTALVFSYLAVSTGSLSLSSLILQYSLIIPAFYGLVFLNEPAKTTLFIGIALLLVSVVLINLEGKTEKKTITLKWGIYALLAFVGNGACSTTQKIQQIRFDGNYKSEFMIIALIISVIVLGTIAIITEKRALIPNLKKGFVWYGMCGIFNGLSNFLVLVLSLRMAASVMFPVISAGGIAATAFISAFIYKEKMSGFQKAGLVLGIASIVMLNL